MRFFRLQKFVDLAFLQSVRVLNWSVLITEAIRIFYIFYFFRRTQRVVKIVYFFNQ